MPAAMPALASGAASPPPPSLAPIGVAGPADDTILVPATVAAGANGNGAPSVVGPPTVAAAVPAGVGSGGGRAGGGGSGTPPRVQIRPGADQGASGPRRPLPPLREPLSREPGLARRIIPGLIGLGAAIVIVVVLLVITSGGTGKPKTTAQHKTKATAKHHVTAPAFNPATVTVAVLNGTAVNNLAHAVAAELTAAGYKGVPPATAADQTHTTTIVGYTPGNQIAAEHIAKSLKLGASTVQPADAQALGVACPNTTTCAAQVVVTVGTDLSAAATAPTTGTTTG